MGKTRLAIALAEQVRAERFADGAYFVALAPARRARADRAHAGRCAGLPARHRQAANTFAPPANLDYLHEKQLLLVLDNVEHLLGDADEDARRCRSDPCCLRLRRAWRCWRPRASACTCTRSTVTRSAVGYARYGTPEPSAVALFVQRARRCGPISCLNADDLSVMAQDLPAGGGMPLAIELAAGWADTLTLAISRRRSRAVWTCWRPRLRDVPARHRSMRAVFDATWQRLDAAEQAVFARLAVFRGGGTRRAVQAITAGDPAPAPRALWAGRCCQYDPARDRYSIHELLRQYAAEQLAADLAEETATRDRHAAYSSGLLRDAGDLQGRGRSRR